TADPALREITAEEFAAGSPSMQRLQDGLNRCLPDLPAEVHTERTAMTRHLITQMTAERERALADGTPTSRATWTEAADGLIDAIVAVWQAPVTPESGQSARRCGTPPVAGATEAGGWLERLRGFAPPVRCGGGGRCWRGGRSGGCGE